MSSPHRALRASISVLRFALELLALAAVSAWGWHAGAGADTSGRVALSVAAPVAVAVLWGRFVAPGAPRYLSRSGRLLVELGVFAAATLPWPH